jgi:hypothetical protein
MAGLQDGAPGRMTLLDDVIEANGGMARWSRLKAFTLHLSISGALFTRFGQARRCRDMVAEGTTQTQFVRFSGFDGPDLCGMYCPDSVSIENRNGEVLQTWHRPLPILLEQTKDWDDLHLVFFCGFSAWNYLTTPFLLAHPDVRIEELSPWYERDQQWRRLQAVFPPGIITHSPVQIFYFDKEGLQRRTDHDLLGTRVANYSWAHQAFSNIMVPTLRRSLGLRPNGSVIRRPALVDVEIFDVLFE